MSDPTTELDIKRQEFLQAIITRMAQNSFTIKGWAVTLVVALLAFGNKDSNVRFALYALYPTFVFWALDAYYLMLERLFRQLSLTPAVQGAPFDFKTTPTPGAFFAAAGSWSVAPLYGVAALMASVIALFPRMA